MSPKSVPSQDLENIRETAGVHDTLLLCDKGHVMQALPTTSNTRLSLSLRSEKLLRSQRTPAEGISFPGKSSPISPEGTRNPRDDNKLYRSAKRRLTLFSLNGCVLNDSVRFPYLPFSSVGLRRGKIFHTLRNQPSFFAPARVAFRVKDLHAKRHSGQERRRTAGFAGGYVK